jgi:hypothetical protein
LPRRLPSSRVMRLHSAVLWLGQREIPRKTADESGEASSQLT